MSAMRSASSTTTTLTERSSQQRRAIRSSSRPGQATRMSTPFSSRRMSRSMFVPPNAVMIDQTVGFGERFEFLFDLRRQLAGGRQDQCTRLPVTARATPVDQRQTERQRLARPGRRFAANVASGQGCFDRGDLDRERLDDAPGLELGDHRGRDPEFGEGSSRHVGHPLFAGLLEVLRDAQAGGGVEFELAEPDVVGVTSTRSSSLMNSSACSRDRDLAA